MHMNVRLLVWFGLAIAVPLLLWTVLALTRRQHPWLVPLIYPGLKVLSVTTATLPLIFGLMLLFDQHYMRQALWLSLSFNAGIQLVRSWAQRRADPESLVVKPNEGWWPTKEDS
jgi:hypothetical protein